MSENCPYCQSELEKGSVDSGRYSFKWHKESIGLLEKITVFGGEVLSRDARVEAYRCIDCNKIIINTENMKPY